MRLFKLLCLMAALALSTSTALANVQFRWTGLSDGTIGADIPSYTQTNVFVADSLDLIVEVSSTAVQSGHISYHSPRNCGPSFPTPVCPVVPAEISYFYAAYADSDMTMRLTFLPITQADWGDSGWNWLDIEADLGPAGFVSGTIDARYHGESEIHLTGENGLFTANFSSDGGICLFHCVGAQGVIADSNSVPEPSTAALMGLGLLGLAARRYAPRLPARASSLL